MPTGDAGAASGQRGFTLVAVLLAMALLALASERIAWVLAQQAMREREAQMRRIGAAYVAAIAAYHQASPGGAPAFPRELPELLEDRRFAGVRRHLRRLYADPTTGDAWLPIRRDDGGIEGVRSAATVHGASPGLERDFVFRPDARPPVGPRT